MPGGAPLGEEESKELKRAKNSAYRYLTFRPRSRAEVEKKLREKGFTEKVVQDVLSGLIRFGYINDETFAEQWAAGRARSRGLGRRRIEQELRSKGIDPEIIRGAVADVLTPQLERQTAQQVADRRLRTLRNLDHETRRRIAGFLERKGFPAGVIWDILNEMQHG